MRKRGTGLRAMVIGVVRGVQGRRCGAAQKLGKRHLRYVSAVGRRREGSV